MMEKEFDNMHNDPFLNTFREKLANHSMPVDPDVWKEVGKAIEPKPKRLPLWLLWSLSSAAALALTITVGSYFINPQFSTTESDFAANKAESNVNLSDVASSETADSTFNQLIQDNAASQSPGIAKVTETAKANRKTNPANAKTVVAEAMTETSNPVKEKILVAELQHTETSYPSVHTEAENGGQTVESSTAATSNDQNTPIGQSVKKSEILQIAQASKDWTEEMMKRQDDHMQLALGVGSGLGGTSALSFGRNMDFMSEKLASAETAMANIMAPEDFPDKNYMPPVSLGLLFRWKTSKQLSLESGLVYSYLLTTMSRQNSWSDARAELNLHYLGVPLNLVATLFEHDKWSIYCSGGVMAEKGLWSFYKQEVYQGPATITTTASNSIKGMQWSLNASLGLSYSIAPDVSLFFDPRLSWYMDNDQPFSVRTHMPLLIGIQAGIRTQL
jgi:hypothetical protein